jgi:hypothetical protein
MLSRRFAAKFAALQIITGNSLNKVKSGSGMIRELTR